MLWWRLPVRSMAHRNAEQECAALRDALSEFLGGIPEADSQNLDAKRRMFFIEHFTAFDVIRHFGLDLGAAVREGGAGVGVPFACGPL